MLLRARCINAKEGQESSCAGVDERIPPAPGMGFLGTHPWEEAGTASAQKMAGEIHPGKNRLFNTLARALLCSGQAWAAFLLSEEPSN